MEAGVELSEKTAAALAEISKYHREHNLGEITPDFVMPALQKLRNAGHKLVVVSNANGTLHRLFDRLGLTSIVRRDPRLQGRRPREAGPAVLRPRALEIGIDSGNDGSCRRLLQLRCGRRARSGTAGDSHRRRRFAPRDCTRIRSIAELPQLLR